MNTNRCEKCVHSSNPIHESRGDAKWITVECNAPVPAYAQLICDDNTTGHMAAVRCPCYEEESE